MSVVHLNVVSGATITATFDTNNYKWDHTGRPWIIGRLLATCTVAASGDTIQVNLIDTAGNSHILYTAVATVAGQLSLLVSDPVPIARGEVLEVVFPGGSSSQSANVLIK